MRAPAMLEISVLEGDGEKFAPGSRAYKGITVQITDETGAPVPKARVNFRMPRSGPGGRFASGGLEEQSLTDSDGKAAAWGIEWNQIPGECRIAIVATAGSARAGTTASAILMGAPAAATGQVIASYEVAPAPPETAPVPPASEVPADAPSDKRPGVLFTRTADLDEPIPGSRNKWLLITLAIGGAVGSGFLYRMWQQRGGTAGATTVIPAALNPPPRPSIGNPTITIGRP
ncbi:MAG: hypothetical protein SFV51_28295 [Bryobacteraceae bacterium]|nr:hypothetical protein [Bryobacteraceae bacterium]